MKMQKGFTLIELVVVMVILGILAAFAIPKFFDFSSQANKADIDGLLGALNSASVTAHGAALANNQTSGNITMEGATVGLVNGYPSASGIVNAVSVSSSFTSSTTGTTTTFTLKTNCTVSYTEAASASSTPTITKTVTGC